MRLRISDCGLRIPDPEAVARISCPSNPQSAIRNPKSTSRRALDRALRLARRADHVIDNRLSITWSARRARRKARSRARREVDFGLRIADCGFDGQLILATASGSGIRNPQSEIRNRIRHSRLDTCGVQVTFSP